MKWEYMDMYMIPNGDLTISDRTGKKTEKCPLIQKMNELGEQGWECFVVNTGIDGNYRRFYLKRMIQ